METVTTQDEERIISAIESMAEIDRPITILLLGRTGVGKSSTINSLFGDTVAPVERFVPGTFDVATYQHLKEGVTFKIIDTPGLCDELPEAGNDERYMQLIQEEVSDVDVVWYVTRLDDERVRADEKYGIKLVTRALGPALWKHAVLVFTGADRVEPALFEETLQRRGALLKSEITRWTDEEDDPLPVVAVSNVVGVLPDGSDWLGELFTATYLRLRDRAAVPFLLSMNGDVAREAGEEGRIRLSEQQAELVRQATLERVIAAAGVGAAFGYNTFRKLGAVPAALGAGAGAILGAMVGWCVG